MVIPFLLHQFMNLLSLASSLVSHGRQEEGGLCSLVLNFLIFLFIKFRPQFSILNRLDVPLAGRKLSTQELDTDFRTLFCAPFSSHGRSSLLAVTLSNETDSRLLFLLLNIFRALCQLIAVFIRITEAIYIL